MATILHRLLVTRDGVPMGHEVFAGGTSAIHKPFGKCSPRSRFQIGRVILCADRGMVSEEILGQLRRDGLEYVVGARPGNMVEEALSYKGANWKEIDGLELRVKPMGADEETYVVCHNPRQELHERERRRQILDRLRAQLQQNPSGSSLLRNTSFRSYSGFFKSRC